MRYIRSALIATAAVVLAVVLVQPARAEVSFDFAYSNLSQHGNWLISAQYGHVWQPTVYTQEWNPYYDGHWVYTDLGWAWVSDYEWGSIPYHYGTWVVDPGVGWVWIPGTVWAPAWVVFRTGPDYIGWAPVSPGFSVGMTMDVAGPSSFVFVSSHDFLAPVIRTSIVPVARTSVFINNTTVVNNIVVQNNVVVNRGPDIRTIEKATSSPIREERIESVAKVAPFEHVSRAQLAVDPASVKQGVRVTAMIPANQPLPVSDQKGDHGRNASPTDAPKSSNGRPSAQPNTQEAPIPPPAAIPGSASDTAPEAPRAKTPSGQQKAGADESAQAQADARVKAGESAKAQAAARAKASQSAKAEADASRKADQSARAQADAKAKGEESARAQENAKTDQSAKAQANARAKADQSAKAQADAKAKADQSAKAQADAKAKSDESAKAQADAKAKADQSAKAQADAKAKKQKPKKPPANPPKPPANDSHSDQGATPETKDEAPL